MEGRSALLPLIWSLVTWLSGSLLLVRFLVFPYQRQRRFCTLTEALWGGIPLGWSLGAIVHYVLVVFVFNTGGLSVSNEKLQEVHLTSLAIFTVLAGALIWGILLGDRTKNENNSSLWKEFLIETKSLWILQLLIVASLLYFANCFYSHILSSPVKGQYWSHGSVYGDLPFHLGLITSFLYGHNSVHLSYTQQTYPMSHFYSRMPLVYPFIPDFHSAVLVSMGGNLRYSIIWPSVLLITSFVVLLYTFQLRLLSLNLNPLLETAKLTRIISQHMYHGAGVVGVIITLLSGGIGGFDFLFNGPYTFSEISSYDWIQNPPRIGEVYWFQPIFHLLLPQRSTIFAYPLVLLVLSVICELHTVFTSIEKEHRLKGVFFVMVVATGLLPLLQPHSLVALGLFCAVYLLINVRQLFKSTSLVLHWMSYGISVGVVSLPQLIFAGYFSRVSDSQGFIRYEPLSHSLKQPLLLLWFFSLGFFPTISLFGFAASSRSHKVFTGGLWFLFVFSNFIMLQPWERDNTKVFCIWLFGTSSSAALFLSKLWHRNTTCKIGASIILFSLVLTGSLMAVREEYNAGDLWQQHHVELSEWVKKSTPQDAVFLTNPMFHANTIHTLAGRSAFLGYLGWVSSHGFPSSRFDVSSTLLDPRTTDQEFHSLVNQHNVSYILIDGNSHFGDWTTIPLKLVLENLNQKGTLVYDNNYRTLKLFYFGSNVNHPRKAVENPWFEDIDEAAEEEAKDEL